MGILDYFKAAKPANQREQLPAPNYYTFNNSLTGRGNGNLLAILQKKLPSSNRDWRTEAGDLSLNGIVAICSRWYLVNFNQIDFKIYRDFDGQKQEIENDILDLLKDPMSGNATPSFVWSNFIQDYLLLGNAYLRKIRGVGDSVIALEYLPADCIRPVGDKSIAVQYYIYNVSGTEYRIEKDDLIHWRFGRDTTDIRLGRSPITSVLREIASDNQASSTAYGLIKNGALPSIIIGPDANENSVDVSPDDLRQIKEKLRQDFSGDQAGGIAVMSGPYKMDRVSFSPSELNLSEIRRLPEERIPAALGLNAMVLGLGAGLERSTYANYQQAQQSAWEDGMLPLLDSLCEVLNTSLLFEFGPRPGDYLDYSVEGVKALSEDLYANSDRATNLYAAGIITRADAKRMINLVPEPEDEGFYVNDANLQLQEMAKSIKFDYYPKQEMIECSRKAKQLLNNEKIEVKDTILNFSKAIINGNKLSEQCILKMYSIMSNEDENSINFNLLGGKSSYNWCSKIRNRLMESGKNISLSFDTIDEDYSNYEER